MRRVEGVVTVEGDPEAKLIVVMHQDGTDIEIELREAVKRLGHVVAGCGQRTS